MTHDSETTVRAVRLLAGFQYAQAAFAVARLGLAGHLMGGPLPVPELARRSGTDPVRLRQLLRVLAGEDVFVLLDGDRVDLGPLGPAFAPDTASSAYELALTWADTLYAPYAELHRTLRDGVPAPEHHYGKPMFDWFADHPEQAARFSASMREGLRTVRYGVPTSLDLGGIRSVVDVGGADGTLLARLAGLYPELTGVVFDLPHVVAEAGPLLASHGLGARFTTAGGDFFVADDLPSGADCYLLSYVLHDWSDVDAERILRAVRTAGGDGARLRLVELVLPDWPEHPLPPFAATMDLTMLGMLAAGERTARDWERMLAATGFRLDRVTPTSTPLAVVEATATKETIRS
ncbi:methyltransferase [Streptomyces sp. NPDC048172]|uniref:methyltransferase n=1 Tax=Streptomyces sp. NPDC048172 TaxID=3365505 RepID=UPI003717CD2E